MQELEQLLKEGENALAQQHFQQAEENYTKVLASEDDYYRALAHLGLAHLAFLTAKPEDAKKYLFGATQLSKNRKGNKDYCMYEKATELCKKYHSPILPDLLESALLAFPLHPSPFIEIMLYHIVALDLPPQRQLLSRMVTNCSVYSASHEEKKLFTDITKMLAKEYFKLAQAMNMNPVDLALDKWTWEFESEHWIKVSEPFYPTLCLTAYIAPNTIAGYYIVEPTGITRLTSKSYLFDQQQLYIHQTKKPMLDEQYTTGETIEDHLEDAADTYYNTLLLNRYKNQIQEFLTGNNGISQDTFKTFLTSLAEEKQPKYN